MCWMNADSVPVGRARRVYIVVVVGTVVVTTALRTLFERASDEK